MPQSSKDPHGFYTSRAWIHKRDNMLRRDKYRCVECARYGRVREAVVVHHINFLEQYPDLALEDSNLQSLCATCHNKKHPEKGGGRDGIRGRYR